uniref:ATP-grasp domain-containing protein n=1 Tax=Leersia perrieri TaxID=77586 RepID=A0A0D9X375_9ORYZ
MLIPLPLLVQAPLTTTTPRLRRPSAPPPPRLHRPRIALASPRLAGAPPPALLSEREMGVAAESEGARPLRVGLVCGGPSAERGVSLNSARAVLDHIQGEDLLVSCYYIDAAMNAFAISPAQLYSNTPSDFDFKLESLAQGFQSLSDFAGHLAANVDIVFPVIHGKFGEDGGIQELLEEANVPFVGSPSKNCLTAFDKYNASLELSAQGFLTVPNFLVEKDKLAKSELEEWFQSVNLNKENGKVIVKPTRAGSSIGVVVAYGANEAAEKAEGIISEGIDDKVIIEVFLEGGSEFTAIVVDVGTANNCEPLVLLPTEIELQSSSNIDIQEDTIFNYRRKYLPTRQVAYHTPPRFPSEVIDCIRQGLSILFRSLGLRDFARIDGWFLPTPVTSLPSAEKSGKIGSIKCGAVLFTDINVISGMEQTSFLFQQASAVGFSHSAFLRTMVQHACLRFPSLVPRRNAWTALSKKKQAAKQAEAIHNGTSKKKVFVLFGGDTSERQVSLMSGTNVWLNLQGFDDLDAIPCLLIPGNWDRSSNNQNFNESSRDVWTLPYSLVLRHTTEEVHEACIEALDPERLEITSRLRDQVMDELRQAFSKHDWFSGFDIADKQPIKYSLQQWIDHVKEAKAVVFIAVHGGIGEDGTIQSLLESAGIPYTGPGSIASRTCIDKVATSLAVSHLASYGVHTIPKDVRATEELLKSSLADIWNGLKAKLQTETDLEVYANALGRKLHRLPANCLSRAHGVIEMPVPPPESLIFEPFIETDEIIISTKSVDDSTRHLVWKGENEWLEVTVGVVGKRGEMRSLNPSITVKESGDILSLEEKFQGGTGINLTPPPPTIMSEDALQKCKRSIEVLANTLGLEGFSRIDAFVNVRSGEVLLIEANTVPGMTPSTVLIHQALAEEPPIYPHKFFRTLLDLAFARAN